MTHKRSLFSLQAKEHSQWSPVFIRLALGAGFIVHGYAKLSRGPMGFAKLLAFSGVPAPNLTAWVGSLTELIGGIALVLGVLVSLVSIPLIVTMLTAMITVQAKYGFSAVKTIGLSASGPVFGPPGYEINIIYIAALLSLIITGAGRFSVDALLAKKYN
jgi:putative oxidoreductase